MPGLFFFLLSPFPSSTDGETHIYFISAACRGQVRSVAMTLLFVVLGAAAAAAAAAAVEAGGDTVTLQNGNAVALLGKATSDFGLLKSLSGVDTAAGAGSAAVSLWSAEYVVTSGTDPVSVNSGCSGCSRTVAVPSKSAAVFTWSKVPIAATKATVTVSLSLNLTSSGKLEHRITFARPTTGTSPSAEVALWSWKLTPVSGAAAAENFENAGFGVMHSPAKAFSGQYPQQTVQFMAAFGDESMVYVGAHDGEAASKGFESAVSAAGSTVSMSVSATPPGAGVPLPPGQSSYTVEWPIVVVASAVPSSSASFSWWDAAMVYREWALAEATWTRQGPMIARSDVPRWLFNLTTWINSHWQGNDIFNTSGGDPEVVKNRVAAIVDRFGLSRDALALHWYEWDTLGYKPGSNYTECATEITCGFDTHYPEYFPVRDGFRDALKAMQALGVRVAPYINGRIFDKATESWARDDAEGSAAKSAAPTLGAQDLSTYEEQYGSKAKFAVMCPHTRYWQGKIAQTVGTLVQTYETDGVYIDQIAAAGPRPCWDPSHNHTLGGGSHWVSGYAEMLRQVRQLAGGDKVILTESNSEPFMGGINLFLTLVGFSRGDYPGIRPPRSSPSRIVPAFQAIYGGYVLPVGAEFFRPDLDGPDGGGDLFAAKVAAQFVFGAQMGWFSLGGRDNQSPPMGIYDLLMSPQHDAEVAYLRALSQAKTTARDWFNHGRAMRPLDALVINGTAAEVEEEVQEEVRERASYGAVMSSTWLSADGKSLLVTFTTVKRATPATVSATIDVAQFPGLNSEEEDEEEAAGGGGCFAVWWMPFDGAGQERKLGCYPAHAVKLEAVLGVRAVVLLRVEHEVNGSEEK